MIEKAGKRIRSGQTIQDRIREIKAEEEWIECVSAITPWTSWEEDGVPTGLRPSEESVESKGIER